MARFSYSSLGFNLVVAVAVFSVLYAHAQVQEDDPPQCDTPDEYIDEMLAKCNETEVNTGVGSAKCCYALGAMYDVHDICVCQRIWEKSGNVTFPRWDTLFMNCADSERGLDCPF
ncbi:hypothetical protein Mapa_006379 [Marchantia paleacea]|nr:hypothetical protein Mapa_006379 [Marchantia paleacea]